MTRPPTTPEAMLALADELEREGDRLKAEAAGWRAVAAARGVYAESISSLPGRPHSGTIDSMNSAAVEPVTPKRTRGVPLESNGPYAKVAKTLGVSLAEVGRRLKENVYTVRTWNARKHVPDGIQEKLDAMVAEHLKSAKRRPK